MILSVELLVALFVVEFALRLALEIRERRATMMRGGIFSVLRLIPLVNDIVPLPESRKEVPESEFVRKHEEGHRHFRHSVLRNIYKVAMLLVSVWVLAAMLVRGGLPLWQAVLWMHLVAIPFRAFPPVLLEPGVRSRPLRLQGTWEDQDEGRHACAGRMRDSLYKALCGYVPLRWRRAARSC